jgi:hypothetical protein
MTPAEFEIALTRTNCQANARSIQAARDALVLGITMYRAAKTHQVTESAVHRACRRLLAAHAMAECPTCGRPYH